MGKQKGAGGGNDAQESVSAKLMEWCKQRTASYKNVKITNFTTSWKDGLVFCAIYHSYKPNMFTFSALSSVRRDGGDCDRQANMEYNLNLAFKIGEQVFDVPQLLDAVDIIKMPRPDDK